MKSYHVYILFSAADKMMYTGITSNLPRRIRQHNQGQCKSTRNRRPLYLIYHETSYNIRDAAAREKYLKSGYGKKYIRNRLKYQLSGIFTTG